jgi:outer membrane protein OmpA-like peptidoglycan-associated protein
VWVVPFARDGVQPLEDSVPAELLACARLEVVGHTDRIGPEEVNRVVGAGRAEAVRRLLVARGVDPLAVVARSAGESEPAAPGEGEDAHRKNRRAVVRCDG